MGQGIDLAREDAPLHAAVIDNFKDQLLLAMVRRLGDRVSIPVAEIDETGGYVLLFSVNDGIFNFELRKKE